jgi:hypothetical protein
LERVPPTDCHHGLWVHLLIDEQSLREAPAEIIRSDVLEVLVASLLGCLLGGPFHHIPDAALGKINEGIRSSDVLGVLIAVDVTLNVGWQVGIARLPTVMSFPSGTRMR